MKKQLTIETDKQKKEREMIATIANNLSSLSRSVSALLNGPLKSKSLVILLAHSSGLPQTHVSRVLNALADLEKNHLKSS